MYLPLTHTEDLSFGLISLPSSSSSSSSSSLSSKKFPYTSLLGLFLQLASSSESDCHQSLTSFLCLSVRCQHHFCHHHCHRCHRRNHQADQSEASAVSLFIASLLWWWGVGGLPIKATSVSRSHVDFNRQHHYHQQYHHDSTGLIGAKQFCKKFKCSMFKSSPHFQRFPGAGTS